MKTEYEIIIYSIICLLLACGIGLAVSVNKEADITVTGAGTGRCSNVTPPAPAAAVGYTKRIFCDDFPNLSSIDVNDAGAAGYKWYPRIGFPSFAAGRCNPGDPNDIWCQTTPTALPSYFAVHPGGGLDFTPSGTGSLVGGTGGGGIMSCRTNGFANQYIGTTLVSATYVRVNVIGQTPAGYVGGSSLTNPAVWAMPIEFLAAPAPAQHFVYVEDDYQESGNSTAGLAHLHEWYSTPPGSETGTAPAYGNWSGLSITNATVARRLVTRAANGGTGEVTGWINDTTASPPLGTTGTPVDWTNPTDRFVEMENEHYCIIIWCGIQTCSIGSVEVWATGP
jgi:hypothetical protein